MEKEIYELHADICRILSNSKRLEILNTLREKEMSVGELKGLTGLSKANLSQHLAILRQRRIVTTRREGVNIYYRIANSKVIKACDLMREVLYDQLTEDGNLAKRLRTKRR
ncbi:MAG: ArsR/SmtB family transcription factor [Candidatus Zixiibacteriota bacterium]